MKARGSPRVEMEHSKILRDGPNLEHGDCQKASEEGLGPGSGAVT